MSFFRLIKQRVEMLELEVGASLVRLELELTRSSPTTTSPQPDNRGSPPENSSFQNALDDPPPSYSMAVLQPCPPEYRSYFPLQISNSNLVWVEIPYHETVSGQWYRAALPNRLGQLINCFNNCFSSFPLVSCPKPKSDCTHEFVSLLALWGSRHLQHWELFLFLGAGAVKGNILLQDSCIFFLYILLG